MDRKEYLSMSHNDRQKITDKIKRNPFLRTEGLFLLMFSVPF